MGPAVKPRDSLFRLQDELRGEITHGHQVFGADGANLVSQKRRADIDFGRLRIAIRRRTAFQYIGDEHVFARKARIAQKLGQVLARRTDKRLALQVFVLTRGLAYEHNARLWIAEPWNNIGPAFAQGASTACGNLGRNVVEQCGGRFAFLGNDRRKMVVNHGHRKYTFGILRDKAQHSS